MDVVIRQAKESDFETLQKFSQDLTIHDSEYDPILVRDWAFTEEGIKYLHERIEGKNCVCLIAEQNGEFVGYATCVVDKKVSWRPMKKRVELENLIVKEGLRGNGIGEKLIQAFFDWGKKIGADRAMVHSYFNNKGAVSFYQRNGLNPLTVELEKILE